MPTATEGLLGAVATGADTYAQGTTQAAIADRTTARARQAQGQQQLETMQYQKDTGSLQTQIDAANKQNQDILNKLAKQDTFDAFRMYDADANPKHLTNAIRNNPVLREVYKDTVSIDKLDISNDQALIDQAGLDLEALNDPETAANFKKRFLKVTRPDGSKEIMDMFEVFKGTGYLNQVAQQDLERMLKESQIQKNLRVPKSGSGSGSQGTALQRNAAAVAAARDRIAAAEAAGQEPTTEDKELVAFGEKEKAGTIPGKFESSRNTTASMLEEFGGPDKFFKTDFTKRENYLRAIPYIREIEQLEGIELTAAQKSQLTDIRSLITLGNPAAEITDAETGLLDNMLLNFKKYVSDEVGGVAATSAYAAFRNSVRHALFGSALTEAEITSFNEAFGTLGQKTGPVLQQFKTSMNQVKASLESIAKMTNPYSAQVRLGADAEAIDQIIDQIDKRINYLSGRTVLPKDKKSSLDSIFKGTGK